MSVKTYEMAYCKKCGLRFMVIDFPHRKAGYCSAKCQKEAQTPVVKHG